MNVLAANAPRPRGIAARVVPRVVPRAVPSVAVLIAALALVPFGAEAGDAQAGKEKAATCTACHGADGIAVAQNYPTLAGQYESYLVHALRGYRSGSRQNAIMYGFASPLSDADIADLAAWYASQPGPLKTAPRP